MIEKLEYYKTAKTDRDGCAREWIPHPNLEDIIDKINEIIEYLNRGEEVDAEPIRHGHWTPYEYGDYHWHKCSECGVADKYIETVHRDGYPDKDVECIRHYCPNCGAKMDEVEE